MPGPYRFVSFTPGVELVLEAHEQYWRKSPSVKRLVLKAVSDEVTRLAMLKRGEAGIAYAFRGAIAEDVRRTPGLGLKPPHSPRGALIAFSPSEARDVLDVVDAQRGGVRRGADAVAVGVKHRSGIQPHPDVNPSARLASGETSLPSKGNPGRAVAGVERTSVPVMGRGRQEVEHGSRSCRARPG